MDSQNLYEILDIENNATQDEIKKAYRKLSMKWHPDRNKSVEAESKFKDINGAYMILSDPQKKQQYDMEQKMGKGMGGMSGMSGMPPMPDIFKVFMGAGGMPGMHNFADLAGAPQGSGMMPPGFMFNSEPINIENLFQNLRKPPPIVNNVSISLEDAYQGISVPLKIQRWNMVGNTKTTEEETIYINVPEGVDENELIITRDKGNSINQDIKGDIKTFIKIENNSHFKRHGLDLDYTHIITLKEALCGFSFELKHLNGIVYQINNKSGTIISPKYKKTIPKKGMKRGDKEGNLNIHFFIEFPNELSEEKRSQIANIL